MARIGFSVAWKNTQPIDYRDVAAEWCPNMEVFPELGDAVTVLEAEKLKSPVSEFKIVEVWDLDAATEKMEE